MEVWYVPGVNDLPRSLWRPLTQMYNISQISNMYRASHAANLAEGLNSENKMYCGMSINQEQGETQRSYAILTYELAEYL